MDELVFSKYGKLNYVTENIILEKTKTVTKSVIINNNTEDYGFIDGPEKMTLELVVEDDEGHYDAKVQFTNKPTNGDMIGNLKLFNLEDLQIINNLLNGKINGNVTPKIITKESKDVKVEGNTYNYTLPIKLGDKTFELDIDTDINNKIYIMDQFVNIVSEDNIIKTRITSNGKDSFTYIDFQDDSDEIHIKIGRILPDGNNELWEYENCVKPENILCPELINLTYNFEDICLDGEMVKIDYDEYGIPMDDSKGLVRYEKFYDEDDPEFLDSIISLHPLYIDLFDNFENGKKNVWVLDQVVMSEVDGPSNLLFYSREVRELSDEENKELSDLVLNAPDDEPILAFIDAEEYHEEFNEREDAASIVNILAVDWVNETNLFKKENNFTEINKFEDMVKKSITVALMDYFGEVCENYEHADRDPEYIDEIFSHEDLYNSICMEDCVISRNSETGSYAFEFRVRFARYIKNIWDKKKMIIVNEFDVFNDRFVPHDPRKLIQVM